MEAEYKILIGEKSAAALKDFFDSSHTSFKFLRTSDVLEDILSDTDIFRPDAFMCFYDGSGGNVMDILRAIRSNAEKTPAFIVVSSPEGCEELRRKAPSFPALIIKTPANTWDMTVLIKKYLDELFGKSANREEMSGSTLEDPAAPPPMQAPETTQKKKILIVDDDKNVLKMLKTVLEEDYSVTCMASGKMTEKYFETKTADLILLDYEMPEESGAEVFQKLRAAPKTKMIPVLFLTGVDDDNKRKEILAMRPQGYLAKPIDMKRLRIAVSSVLE